MNQITKYTISLVNLYGLIDEIKLAKLYCQLTNQLSVDLSKIDLIKLQEYGIQFIDNHYCAMDVNAFIGYKTLLELQTYHNLYTPKNEQVLNYLDAYYYQDDLAEELINHLVFDLNIDSDYSKELVDQIIYFIKIGAKPEFIFNELLATNHIYIEEIPSLINYILNLYRTTRCWSLSANRHVDLKANQYKLS